MIFFGKPVPTFPDHALASSRVALHATGIGCGTSAAADLRCGGQAAFRPVGADLDEMPAASQRIDGRFRDTIFEHQHAWPRGAWPERDREMFGMTRRRVDRLL